MTKKRRAKKEPQSVNDIVFFRVNSETTSKRRLINAVLASAFFTMQKNFRELINIEDLPLPQEIAFGS